MESTGTADRSLEVRELRARIDRILRTLAPADREVLVWSEVAGLSQREIATLLEIPAGTVASRKSRAVRQVRERWEGDLP
jgi:RNA polymerase sigma-70 factor (ECF subfamily)